MRITRFTVSDFSARLFSQVNTSYDDGQTVVVTERDHGFEGGAVFGPGGPSSPYRYNLWRQLEPGNLRRVLFLMLNPSTADHRVEDPTVRRCMGYARRWGFGVLEVANLFAWRSTDPQQLYRRDRGFDPIGEANDAEIVAAAKRCQSTVCAWGTHGALLSRGHQVIGILRRAKVDRRCLKKTKHGDPAHPLYLRADLSPGFL